jgi:hypothetical protein
MILLPVSVQGQMDGRIKLDRYQNLSTRITKLEKDLGK